VLDELTPEVLDQLARPHWGLRDPWPLPVPELLTDQLTAEHARPVLELDTTRRPLGGSW
jgi:hypothetical protein